MARMGLAGIRSPLLSYLSRLRARNTHMSTSISVSPRAEREPVFVKLRRVGAEVSRQEPWPTDPTRSSSNVVAIAPLRHRSVVSQDIGIVGTRALLGSCSACGGDFSGMA